MSLTPLVLLDTKIYLDAADLTGYSNKVMAAIAVADLDRTTFASAGSKERVGGLFDIQASLEGFWQAGLDSTHTDLTKPDDVFFANLSNSKAALTFVPTGNAVGSLAYVTRVMETQYEQSGQVGELYAFAVDWSGNWPLARGQLLMPNTVAKTSTGNGTALQLGAITAGQRMYANLHVQAVSGTTPSCTVTIQSAASSAFTSPTTQITFTAATGIGGQSASVLGPITDTWWRAVVTISGTTPSFTLVSSAGVAAK